MIFIPLAIFALVVIFLFFIFPPMIKKSLDTLLRNLIGAVVIIGLIFLCIAFPPTILIIISIIIYAKLNGGSFNKANLEKEHIQALERLNKDD